MNWTVEAGDVVAARVQQTAVRERETYHHVLGPVADRVRCALRVRRGRGEDLAALVRMAVRFIAESGYRGQVIPNVERLQILAQYLLDHGAVFVAQVDGGDEVVGMLGLSLVPHVMSGELVAGEVAWWLEPEYRGGTAAVRLLDAGEAWAREQGAVWVEMIAPAGDAGARVAEFYRRRGYVEVESLFRLRLLAA